MPLNQTGARMLSCPVCSESAPLPLFTLTDMPLTTCQFAESRANALHAARGTLELVLCKSCGHIYNRAFEPNRVAYSPGYENALHFSARHRTESEATAERLIRSYALHHKTVVEFGCGTAEFLSLLCAKGSNLGVGYDPSQHNRTTRVGDGSVTICAKKFSSANQKSVDLVCSQHVLEHLDELLSTLGDARACLKHGGIGYFQVPNGLAIFRDLNIWDLIYEHVSYFSPASLHRALSETGFSVLRLETSFGGQYLDADVIAGEPTDAAQPALVGYSDFCGNFPAAFAKLVGHWKSRIASLIESDRRIVLWGGGAKAVSFLNMLRLRADNGIEYVVDVNPRKAGLFVPGTAQEIVPPKYLCDYRPDVVVVMNPVYAAEIQSMLESMRLRCDMITVSSTVA
jgi:SAM-dependent methyltransferase